MGVLAVLLIIVIIVLIIFGFYLLIDWLTHIGMTKDHTTKSGWTGYKKFVEHFSKVDWKAESFWAGSCWDRLNDCEYHANIIKINGAGMIINNPISYFLVKQYVRNYLKPQNKVKW